MKRRLLLQLAPTLLITSVLFTSKANDNQDKCELCHDVLDAHGNCTNNHVDLSDRLI